MRGRKGAFSIETLALARGIGRGPLVYEFSSDEGASEGPLIMNLSSGVRGREGILGLGTSALARIQGGDFLGTLVARILAIKTCQ